jgi:hypothetical protein
MEPLFRVRFGDEEAHHITLSEAPMTPWEREREARARAMRLRVLAAVAVLLGIVDTALVLMT